MKEVTLGDRLIPRHALQAVGNPLGTFEDTEGKMKRLILIVCSLVASVGVASAKQLDAAWNNCLGVGTFSTPITFDCANEQNSGHGVTYELFHTFTLDSAIPSVIAAQGIVNYIFQSPGIPDWWVMTGGGCNDGSVDFNYLRGTSCAGSSSLLCGTSAALCSGSGVAGIGYGYGAPNKARAIIALARPSTSPVNLTAAKHYAWRILFFMDNPNGLGPCAGCETPVFITLDWLDIFDINSTAYPIGSADGASEPTVCANTLFPCYDGPPVSARSKTWGQLKALYR